MDLAVWEKFGPLLTKKVIMQFYVLSCFSVHYVISSNFLYSVPLKVHIGLGYSISEIQHEKYLLFSKTASVYVRNIAVKLFGSDVILAKTFQEMDPHIVRAIESK